MENKLEGLIVDNTLVNLLYLILRDILACEALEELFEVLRTLRLTVGIVADRPCVDKLLYLGDHFSF